MYSQLRLFLSCGQCPVPRCPDKGSLSVCVYIYIYIHTHIYIYIYMSEMVEDRVNVGRRILGACFHSCRAGGDW